MPNFYDNCLTKIFKFVYQHEDLSQDEIYTCLRNIIGHEPSELLKNPKQQISLTDIRTDLKCLFEEIIKKIPAQ